MTTMTTHRPTAHPQGRTTVHKVLAGVVGLGTLAYAAAALWVAVGTADEIAGASPSDDTSLYGLGYLIAGALGLLGLACGLGGAVGWWVARRHPDAGTVVLSVATAMAVLPIGAFAGFPF